MSEAWLRCQFTITSPTDIEIAVSVFIHGLRRRLLLVISPPPLLPPRAKLKPLLRLRCPSDRSRVCVSLPSHGCWLSSPPSSSWLWFLASGFSFVGGVSFQFLPAAQGVSPVPSHGYISNKWPHMDAYPASLFRTCGGPCRSDQITSLPRPRRSFPALTGEQGGPQ